MNIDEQLHSSENYMIGDLSMSKSRVSSVSKTASENRIFRKVCRNWNGRIFWFELQSMDMEHKMFGTPYMSIYMDDNISSLIQWVDSLTRWLTVSSWRVFVSVNWFMGPRNGLWSVRYPPDHSLNRHRYIAKTNISVPTSATFESKCQLFVSGKWIWKCQLFISEKWIWECQLQIVGHCVQVTMC